MLHTALVSALLLPISQQSNACEEQLASCEHVLSLADIAITKQAETIDAQARQIDQYRLAVETARPAVEAYGAWYNNKWLWISVGIITGAVAHKELAH